MVNHRVPLFKPYPTGIMVKCCLLFTFIFLQMESQREESDNKSRYIMGGGKKKSQLQPLHTNAEQSLVTSHGLHSLLVPFIS